LKYQRQHGQQRIVAADGERADAEGEQVEDEGDQLLVDMRQGGPVLRVAGVDEDEKSEAQSEKAALRPDGLEGPPRCQPDEEADDEGEDLPVEGDRGNETGGEEEDRPEKWAVTCKRGDELCRAHEAPRPGEAPIIPVETGRAGQQPVSEQGEQRE
jgi:hypothetical protein